MAEQDERVLDETEVENAEQSATAGSDADTASDTNKTSDASKNTSANENNDEFARTMDRVEAALSEVADKDTMTPQMRKMFARQQESTKRVEESIKGTKSNPRWFVPVLCALLIIGLVWVVVYYLSGKYPIPGINDWNLAIGFGIMLVGFLMTMWWH